jgi:hypothetical protein
VLPRDKADSVDSGFAQVWQRQAKGQVTGHF